MLNTISPEKRALAVIPKRKRKEGSDYNEKDKSATIVLRLVIVDKNAGNCMDVLYMGVEGGVVIVDKNHARFKNTVTTTDGAEEGFPWKRCKLTDV